MAEYDAAEHAVAAVGGRYDHEPPRLNRNVTPDSELRVPTD